MKALVATMLIAGAIQAAPALAQPPAVSPLVGSWAVDVSRLPMPPAARPKSVTIAFRGAGEGKWVTQVDIVDADGTKRHTADTAALDGTAIKIKDSTEADTVAMKMPAPNVLVMGLGMGGMPASTRVYTVAADGRTMIETAVNFDGVPVLRTHYFTRIR